MTTATPTRDRHPFPQSAIPSPGPSQRHPALSSAPIPPPSAPSPSPSVAQSSPQPITADALLKQFAASPDPRTAALEQAVADRNVLSAQNSQLWKLIEKQRTGYNQILKELERIRAERDTYKGRLVSLTGTASSSANDKRHKSSTDRDRDRGRPSLDTTSSHAASLSSVAPLAPRNPAARHNSDDSVHRSINHPHALHPSRSFDPTRQNTNDIDLNSNPILTATRTNSPQPAPPPSSAPSLTTRQPSSTSRPNPTPLVVPTRADTLPASYTISDSPDSSTSTSNRLPNPYPSLYENGASTTPTANGSSYYASTRPLVAPRKSSIADSISSVVTSRSSVASVSASIAASSPSTSILSSLNSAYTFGGERERDPTTPSQQQYSTSASVSVPPHATSVSVSMSTPASGESAFSRQRQLGNGNGNPSLANIQPSPLSSSTHTSTTANANANTMLSPEPRPHFLSRDSRISLPDEARQYIANMADSPAASPRAEAFSPRSKLSNSVFPPSGKSEAQNGRESEFLDMGEEDDDEEDEGEDDRLVSDDEEDGQGDITAGAHDPTFNGLRAGNHPAPSSQATTISNPNNTNDLSQAPAPAGYQYPPPTNYNNNNSNNNNYPPSQSSYTTSELQQQHQQRLKDQQQQQQAQRDKPQSRAAGPEEFQFPLPPAAAPPTANNPIYIQRQQALAAQQELQAQAQAQAQSYSLNPQQQQQQGQMATQQAPSVPAPTPSKHAQAPADQLHHPGSMSGNHDLQSTQTQMQEGAAYLGQQSAGGGYPTNRSESSFQSQGSQSQSQQQQQQTQVERDAPIQPHPTSFRALPLLSSDLPHTSITVSHSFVRPNDRGKEVLSFIVFVNPGNGKDGWKVEKMYSDVLGLDSRVRNSVGKGVGKKIASLPEGKLWKDHAPAKVDQRKAVLENYLQTLIQLPVKNNDEVIAFFTSDIVREQKQPVMQAGHKEGYLTKRGKNFGGWKTRFFVLQGPVLEYYDCRGGAHLGSISITGAQIARQHRTEKPPSNDDEKEYRHAFLIVEAKKGPGGNHPRHVLCAESDEDRDSWVEMLVRYYTGTYSDDLVFNSTSGLTSVQTNSVAASQSGIGIGMSQPRSSSSSSSDLSTTAVAQQRSNGGKAIPISVLPPASVPNPDDYMMRSSSPSRSVDPSPIDRHGPSLAGGGARVMERSALGLPSSLPDSSPLSAAAAAAAQASSSTSSFPLSSDGSQQQQQQQRANSELGHYPDLQETRLGQKNQRQHSPDQHRTRPDRTNDDVGVGVGRKPFYPSLTTVAPSPTAAAAHGAPGPPSDRVPSPEKQQQQDRDANAKVKISGPMNGAPIPSGIKFGGKEPSSADLATAASANDRREKAKSRSFWGFGKANGDKSHLHAAYPPRAVFGVPLEEALDVAQMCNLPAIVFRAIQYLEAKKAHQEEGIYRLSGSSAEIKNLKDRFNNEGDVDLLASDQYWDPHAIAGLLKSFLRELPSSILTRDLHLKFLAVIDFVDPQERIKELSQLIAAMPLANYSLLRALTAHLILIVQNSNVNKMTMRNVGIVFSPTLGIPAGVFSLMLGEFNRVFNVDADNDDLGPKEGEALENPSEPLKRNSRQYTDAAADQVLGLAGRTLSAADETQSDGDDFSIQDESGTETTEGDTIIDSSSSSSPASAPDNADRDPGIRISEPDTPSTPTAKTSKASSAAASRGLNVAVTQSDRGNRHSRMMGLPSSPRPGATAHPSPSRQEVPVNSSPTPGWPNEQLR